MEIRLYDTNPIVVGEWKQKTSWISHQGSILDAELPNTETTMALVSPANSFGFMDGGIDQVYTDEFGPEVQTLLQSLIVDLKGGELLVGDALAIPLEHSKFSLMISAPTMSYPRMIPDPQAVYLAAKAATKWALDCKLVDILCFPGMGCGAGALSPWLAVKMMKHGILDALSPRPFPTSWRQEANRRNAMMNYGETHFVGD